MLGPSLQHTPPPWSNYPLATQVARNLDVMIDHQLSFFDLVASCASQSCRLHNKPWEKLGLTWFSTLLNCGLEAMVNSCPNYCNALPVGLAQWGPLVSSSGFQSALLGTCKSAAHWPPLVTHGNLNQIQVINVLTEWLLGLHPFTWTQPYRLMLLFGHHRLALLFPFTRQSQPKLFTDGLLL